jgi:hypothetical protein
VLYDAIAQKHIDAWDDRDKRLVSYAVQQERDRLAKIRDKPPNLVTIPTQLRTFYPDLWASYPTVGCYCESVPAGLSLSSLPLCAVCRFWTPFSMQLCWTWRECPETVAYGTPRKHPATIPVTSKQSKFCCLTFSKIRLWMFVAPIAAKIITFTSVAMKKKFHPAVWIFRSREKPSRPYD